ncbi:hypothetical protein NX774_21045 [Massilia agilis]|uniref:Transmembrane protein n=1 Tax=Massilia agilis TaxID=1811226 RepID=A0ABT2DGG5_9BURK|nr:hypothetical protein [Massilia agilis]MCS0810417.1 hypothetical protein [Massilia agilis]
MIVGTMPLVLGLIWIVSVIFYAQTHKGQMGGSDAFLMIGVLFITYSFAFLVGGGSALWSALVARGNPDARTRASTLVRRFVCILLGAPLAGYFGLNLFSFLLSLR